MWIKFGQVLLALSTFHSPLTQADQDALEFIYEPELAEEPQLLFDRISVHTRNGEFNNALTLSDTLLTQAKPQAETHPALYGKLLVNHGIIQTASTDYESGLASIGDGLDFIERQEKPFSTSLIRALMARGITEFSLEAMTRAEDSFRRAQHIMHRNQGVYAPEQLPVIAWLTRTNLKAGNVDFADREQKFRLRVAEQAFGPESLDLLPHLNNLGAYFASRGDSIPPMLNSPERLRRDLLFKSAVRMYQRAVTIIEQKFGENDLRLVPSLRGLANARMLQVTNRRHAESALVRSLAIVESNPHSDPSDRALALVDLGDFYTIINDKKAAEVYTNAWNLLQADEETKRVAEDLFGAPTRLYPRNTGIVYLERQPDAPRGSPLFVRVEYTVRANGKVGEIDVLEKNVPNEQVRLLRYRIRSTKFRPRIENGQVVETKGLMFSQPYRVLKNTAGADLYVTTNDTEEVAEPVNEELSEEPEPGS